MAPGATEAATGHPFASALAAPQLFPHLVALHRLKTNKDVGEAIIIRGGASGNARLDDFARSFVWADDKFPVQASLRESVDGIVAVRA